MNILTVVLGCNCFVNVGRECFKSEKYVKWLEMKENHVENTLYMFTFCTDDVCRRV